MRRALASGAALLAVYFVLSLAMSPRGFLGTDTGGKVATLEMMTAGPGLTLDPDVGYWAEEFDPDGELHPLYYTAHIGERWVNVTTLPMLVLAAPLYDVGGYRLALLLPMLGSIAAAFAAAAIARRLGGSEWLSFWAVGIASPMTIYALDFWEHSIGVALMAWAIVFLWDMAEWLLPSNPDRTNRAVISRATAAGVLLGLAASLRTETFVVAAASGTVIGAWLLVRRDRPSLRSVAGSGLLVVSGFVAVFGLASLVEWTLVGTQIRGARAGGLAAAAGDAPDDRIREALLTLLALVGNTRGIVLGAAFAALVAYASWRAAREPRLARVALVGATGLLVLRLVVSGPGFVPGLFAAWPFAAAVVASRRPLGTRGAGLVVAIAVAVMPLVLATQFTGGAEPQWAGRYLLVAGFLLTAVALASVPVWRSTLGTGLVTLALVVTLFGVGWLSIRSRAVAGTIAGLEARPEEVIVSSVAHLAREGGATYGQRRWLTAAEPGEEAAAAAVARRSGARSFVLVSTRLTPRLEFPGWVEGDADPVILFDGVVLFARSFERR